MEEDHFKRALRNLVLEAFANGETVDGVWNVENVPDEIPDWTVTIERVPDRLAEQAAEQADEQIV